MGRRYKSHGRDQRGPLNNQWKGGRTHYGGYPAVLTPGHSRAIKGLYVLEHILVAEKALGRPLPPDVEVHHTRGKDDPRSIVICENKAYHRLLHVRTEAYRATGRADSRRCEKCGRWDVPGNLSVVKPKKTLGGRPGMPRAYHLACPIGGS